MIFHQECNFHCANKTNAVCFCSMKRTGIALISLIACLHFPSSFARTTTDILTSKVTAVENLLNVTDDGCLSVEYGIRSRHWRQVDKERLRSILNYAYSYSSRCKFSTSERPTIEPETDKNMRLLISDPSFAHWAGSEVMRAVNDMASIRLRRSLPDNPPGSNLTKNYEDTQRHLIDLVREKFDVLEEVANADGCY
jgi:hypothetical protein